MVLGHRFCIYRGEVVHLPIDFLYVLFVVNIDGTFDQYIYIYMYVWIYILGSFWCSHMLMFFGYDVKFICCDRLLMSYVCVMVT
jgi:hypothetical protein